MCGDTTLRSRGVSRSRCGFLRSLLLCLALANALPALAFESPLDIPARLDGRLANSPLLAVVNTGERLVAAGLRGGIIVSSDQGTSWIQAQVPVSVDLVAISFPSTKQGWAVGHGGVVLHSEDGGLTWQKQLDGHEASQLAIEFYARNPEHVVDAEAFLIKEQNLAVDKETQPFLDVFFVDDQRGYVVGTFNRIFMTDDGGRNWEPLMHLTDNQQEWHFYAISGQGGQLYLSGEQGHVWRFDAESKHFIHVNTPYNGTLFGLSVEQGGEVYAYGMRGSFFRSADQGRSWERLSLPFSSNVMKVFASPGQLLVVAQGGEIVQSTDGGHSFKPLSPSSPMPYFAAALMDSTHLILVGALGVRIEAI
ncbi:YCF48-related protein [Pseudomonas sp.]|uniref:YCF48-related protein n=1 Tax=Pseudomonas sp. TaxID=306 RepID=UPI0032678535